MKKLTASWLESRLIERPRWHPSVVGHYCERHPAARAADRCDRCGHAFCADCLRRTERWRICLDCLDHLQRERAGPTWGERWRRFREVRPSVLAAIACVGVTAGVVLLLIHALGSANSAAITAAAGLDAGCIQQFPDRGRLYVVGGVSLFAPVPAKLELRNCGFLPGEQFEIQAFLDGFTISGGVHNVLMGKVSGQATDEGELVATLILPEHATYHGRYDLHLRATGSQGSISTRDIHGGESPSRTPTAGPCLPAPQPCGPDRGSPAFQPN